jgi:mannose-1-phosphate guanylyltransferase
MRYAMIMAGGAGTRLWPMSRKDTPKQILRFIQRGNGKEPQALLELADQRLDGLIEPKRRCVCTAEAYRDAVRALLPKYSDERILGEPAARDTVNAIGFTAAVLAKEDEDAVFAVLTSDHVIEPTQTFRERMDLGFRLVERDPRRFVTFSIKPTYPATAYGYVERGMPIREPKDGKLAAVEGAGEHAYHVARFVEKPDLARAEAYFASGDYGWNSGMFVWKATTFLEALQRFKPESYDGLMKIQKAWGSKSAASVLREVYPTLPKVSVDYAVMEPAASNSNPGKKSEKPFSVCTVQMDLTWLDVGSWPAYAETLAADPKGNRPAGAGTVVLHDCKNTLAIAGKGHTVALLGVQDLIVVHTPDATLIMPRSRSEDLKLLHGQIDGSLR